MSPLIYPEEYENEDSLNDPTSAETTPNPVTPSGKPTKEPTSEPDSYALSESSAPTREDSMGHLSQKDISRYQKGSYPPRFTTLEERTKEDTWGNTRQIRILGQDKSLEVEEYLITLTESPYQIPTNLEEVDKNAIAAKIMREDM